MSHNAPCENARSHKCRCSGCGGSLHGWPGHLRRAEGAAEGRESLRLAAEQRWCFASGVERGSAAAPRRLNWYLKSAAADTVVVDIVDWLATGEEKRSCVRRVGNHACSDTLQDIDGYAQRNSFRNEEVRNVRNLITGHFWCSLLAEVSGVADTADDNIDRVPLQAMEKLFGNGDNPKWGETKFYVSEFALTALWLHVKPLVVTWDLENFIRIMRILAVLICPDPGSHPRVARLCMRPLVTDILTEAAGFRLRQSFGTALETAPAA